MIVYMVVGILLFSYIFFLSYNDMMMPKAKTKEEQIKENKKYWRKFCLVLFISLYAIIHPVLGASFITRNDTEIAKFEHYTVFEDKDGIAYILDIHSFKFWDMYEKKALPKEYANTLKNASNNYKKYNISQNEILEKMEKYDEIQK